MSDKRLIGLVVAAVVVVALILFGVYHFRTPSTEPKPQAEQSETAPEAPKAEGEAAPGAETEPSKAAAEVPSFDVVRIEGTGEGVIAGRAAPGWTIRIESNGDVVAETTADEDGAWSVVLDKPLTSGDHSLTLKAVSPDGTSSLSAQQPVKVAVGEGPAVAAAEPEKPADAESAEEAPAKPPRPIVFKDVQYEDTGPDSGKLTIAGEGAPGASILLFFDEQALGQVTIGPDGTWTFEADTKIDSKDHSLRADLIEAGTGVVVGRTAAAFRRREQVAVSSQPQPVYPDGPPPEAAPPPPTSMAATEPPSVANQPQPVFPGGPPPEAASSTAVAAADSSLASQPQPAYPEGAPEGAAASPEEAETTAAEPAGRKQPEPVYPDGPPPTTAAPSYPAVTAEPPSVASQPQPVYPPEPSTEVAAAEPPSVETQPQPVVPEEQPAVPEEQPAVTAEAPGETPRVHERPMIVFRGVHYEDTGADKGTVQLSGTGDPGARIQLFLDNAPLGEVTVGSDGNWSFETETKLATGEHNFRADRIDTETGAVVGRASIGMARMEPPKEEEVAAQEPEPPAPAAEAPPEQDVAAAEEPAPAVKKSARRSSVYTVRRGDTLWDIAEYYLGGGWRYRAIVRENRRKIRDPHWIYPRQEFTIPIQR
jgi:hypothetical protein